MEVTKQVSKITSTAPLPPETSAASKAVERTVIIYKKIKMKIKILFKEKMIIIFVLTKVKKNYFPRKKKCNSAYLF